VNRYAEQRLKLDVVQADSTWWWQRQRNNVFLAYIIHSNDEFDIEEFTEGARFAFEALNTAMYCGEPVTEETFHGMVRIRLHLRTACVEQRLAHTVVSLIQSDWFVRFHTGAREDWTHPQRCDARLCSRRCTNVSHCRRP
jgi:hypothetical protein